MASPSPKKANGGGNKKPFSAVPGPTQPQPTSRLLRLPAELRNRIYTLTFSEVIHYRSRKTLTYRKPHLLKPSAPGLLLTCKQTATEATALFYTASTFAFDSAKHLQSWSRKIGVERAGLVKSIRLSSPMPQAAAMASSFWEPRNALWIFSMEVSTALLKARQGLPKGMKGVKVETDLYLPGVPEICVVWTECPAMVVEKFLKEVDEKVLNRTHQAFLMLSHAQNAVW